MTGDPMRQVIIRMPADMHDALKKRADEADRTMAAEVRRLVRRALQEDE